MLDALLSAFPPIDPDLPIPDRAPSEAWEENHLLAIGSPDGVREMILELHKRGFAEVSAWSKLLPAPTPPDVMSILTKRRSREQRD